MVGGRYRIEDVVGTGAMGTVWRGFDTRLRRPVAVKEVNLPATATDDQRTVLTRRAMSEARHAARVAHPNIVAVHDVVADHGLPCLVMRLVEGRSLGESVRAEGPVSPARAAQIGIALVDALAAAHRGGVVHRDVKPSNVLLTDDGEVLLTDFSIATDSFRGTMSAGSGALGSPGYIAPERLNGHPTGPEADLFGLGATLFCAVEGSGPFDRTDPLAALLATATAPHPAPRRAGALAPLLDVLLDKDPAARPDLARTRAALVAVAHAPEPVVDDAPTEELQKTEADDEPSTPPRSAVASHAAPPSGRRIRTIIAGLAVAVCAAVVLAAVVLQSGGGKDDGRVAATASLAAPAPSGPDQSASPAVGSPSPSASKSTTPTPTPPASASKSAAPSPSASPEPVGRVTAAELSVSPTSYLGSCAGPVPFTVDLSVAVSDAPTDVRYTISLAPGDSEVAGGGGSVSDAERTFDTSDQVGLEFSQGSGTYAVQAIVESPTRYSPVPAQIRVVCVG
ncbi:Serine/threonine protein kinase [Cryptosporangium aurantiacum]|uniref:non-specific serine/threonine protein kinase n=2 Tax=Cryptosporangium aurantiacum TaxID=134849 RepID=A0A1M7RNU4_9ACTN|nr:Serine/threonine protein kinase [Cryptosporangium aurantiacum]